MKTKLILISLMLLALPLFGQEAKTVFSGKIFSGTHPLKEILIVNISGQIETRSNSKGAFKLAAKAGDTLIFTDPGIIDVKVVVEPGHFRNEQYIEVSINSSYELDEVVVDKDNRLTAEGLRIIPKGVAKYTDAERKVQTGARLGPRGDANIGGGTVINGDAIINVFNGRRKALKKALETERSEDLLKLLSLQYDAETIVARFSITKEYVQGFLFYAAADDAMISALQANDAAKVDELMPVLALQYTDLLNEK